MPHLIHFRDKGNVTWRQTDVVFAGLYKIHETSAQDLLDQYTEKMDLDLVGGMLIRIKI